MRLALFGFLRFCVQEQQFESTWLPPAVTDKDLVTTKKRIGYPLTDSQILRLLDSFPVDEVVIDYDLNKINDHKSHSFYNVTSLEAFAKILDNPFAREWDKANNCKDIVYKLEGPL